MPKKYILIQHIPCQFIQFIKLLSTHFKNTFIRMKQQKND